MNKPPARNPLRHLRPSDLRAVAQLATQATAGVARMAEGVHQSVWSSLGLPGGKAPGQTRGLTGLVYQSVQGVTQLVGKGLDAALAKLQPLFESAEAAAPGTPQREAVLAALNGVAVYVIVYLTSREEQQTREIVALEQSLKNMAIIEERNRIARDIHDGLGASLSGVIIQAEYLLPLTKKLDWGYHIPYMVTGVLNEHPRSAMKLMSSENRGRFREFYESLREPGNLE